MKTCHNCACDPVCNHTWNGWETCGNWIQKPEKPLTNADHIRAMSDEGLAEFLSDFKDCAGDCLVGRGVKDCSGICATRETLKMWLKQPAEEDT